MQRPGDDADPLWVRNAGVAANYFEALDVPILAMSQLSRAVEQRHDKRPILSDLRESGSIEQDADLVILLHRDRSDPERDGEADVIVAKHRNGPTKDIVLAFQGHYSRFNNMARDGGF